MVFSSGFLRPLAAITIGAGSILAGLLLAFRLVTPALVAQLPTLELVGLLGLLVLPPLTFWALWADRNALSKLPIPVATPAIQSCIIEPKPLALDAAGAEDESEIELVEVHAPGRRTVRHRRHEVGRVGG